MASTRPYEVTFIVRPDVDETGFTMVVDKVKGWITAAGGAVTSIVKASLPPTASVASEQVTVPLVSEQLQAPPCTATNTPNRLGAVAPGVRFAAAARSRAPRCIARPSASPANSRPRCNRPPGRSRCTR